MCVVFNKCFDWSMEVKLSTLLGHCDRQPDQTTNQPKDEQNCHREVSRPTIQNVTGIKNKYSTKIFTLNDINNNFN